MQVSCHSCMAVTSISVLQYYQPAVSWLSVSVWLMSCCGNETATSVSRFVTLLATDDRDVSTAPSLCHTRTQRHTSVVQSTISQTDTAAVVALIDPALDHLREDFSCKSPDWCKWQQTRAKDDKAMTQTHKYSMTNANIRIYQLIYSLILFC